jgi:hypothetical protein
MTAAPTTHQMIQIAKAYVRAGRIVLPLPDLKKKVPGIKWKHIGEEGNIPSREDVIDWFSRGEFPGMAVLCGHRRGRGLLCVDHDRKNDGGAAHDTWYAYLKIHAPRLLEVAVTEESLNKGLHYYWLRDEPFGKATPARTAEGKTLIEVQGEPSIAVCFPTPGYTRLQGDLTQVTMMTREEWAVLCTANSLPNKYAGGKAKGKGSTTSKAPDDDSLAGTRYGHGRGRPITVQASG